MAIPSTPRVRRTAPMCLVRVLTWLGAAAVLATPFFSPGSPVSFVRVAVEKPIQLVISGSISDLHAGQPAMLLLTLTSAAEQAVVVRSVTVRVTGATAGCSAAALHVGSWAGQLSVREHGRATASVPVSLDDPKGRCIGATWQLAYVSA
jgi:hypothetical protein